VKEEVPLAIDVHNLTKRFGKNTVVNRINLVVPQGKVYGFLGPNGQWKNNDDSNDLRASYTGRRGGHLSRYDLRKESENIRKNDD
jgi:ABC-2 type transport system ATP-binding protein